MSRFGFGSLYFGPALFWARCVTLNRWARHCRSANAAPKLALALALLVPWVTADDVNAAFAPDDLTVFANPFDAGSNFHGIQLSYLRVRILPVRTCAMCQSGSV